MDRGKFSASLGVPVFLLPNGKHQLSKEEFSNKPHIRWNAFIDIISRDPESYPTGLVRNASLLFLYDSQVQYGCHYQYFTSFSGKYADETVIALIEFGDLRRANWLSKAIQTHQSNPDSDLERFDFLFHKYKPELIQILESHLDKDEALYIEWV